MFDRPLLKENAKQALKRFYWPAIVATLIVNVISGFGSNFTYKQNISHEQTQELTSAYVEILQNPDSDSINSLVDATNEALSSGIGTAFLSVGALVLVAVGILFSLFVIYQLEVGTKRFYLCAREKEANLGDLFWSYKNNLGTTMGALFCRDLYVSLWSLLLFIPGIVKGYEYSMIPYLLAENPNMTRSRAFKLSKAMTRGYKWELFVLDLSFIGWRLLGFLCCCAGVFFLVPYIEATKAEAYTFLKARAIERGDADASEFAGFVAPIAAE